METDVFVLLARQGSGLGVFLALDFLDALFDELGGLDGVGFFHADSFLAKVSAKASNLEEMNSSNILS